MTKINHAYFNPFSDQFHALDDFKKLNNFQKVVTIVGTFFASLFTLGTFSVCSFRLLVGRFSSKVNSPSADNTNQVSQRILRNQANGTSNIPKPSQNQEIPKTPSATQEIPQPSEAALEIPQKMNELIDNIADEDIRNCTNNLRKNLEALKLADNNPVIVKMAVEKFLVRIEPLLKGIEEEKDGIHFVLLRLEGFQSKQYEKLAFGLLEDYLNDPELEVGNISTDFGGSWGWSCAKDLLNILKNSEKKDEYLKKFINKAFENEQYNTGLVLLDAFSSDETRDEFALEKAKILHVKRYDNDFVDWFKKIRAEYKPKKDLILSIIRTILQELEKNNKKLTQEELEREVNQLKTLNVDSATVKEVRQFLGLPN